jgi:diadenosine tetraphosphate (Ap4A) HIT family hydrolase
MVEMQIFRRALWIALALMPAAIGIADVSNCACDTGRPDTLSARECSLCAEAEKHPHDLKVFFVRDINPRKPNRWLALPRVHHPGYHALRDLTAEERTELWSAAIGKAKELWGEEWGVAYNGDEVRTQCHAHLHIGKYLRESESEAPFRILQRPADIPAPQGEGMWVHSDGTALHVHSGPQITERFLLR